LRDLAGDLLPRIEPKPLGPEHFVKTEELQEALRGLCEPDPKRFFEEIDAIFDPTPREWSEGEW
jgi:hypothetical protein